MTPQEVLVFPDQTRPASSSGWTVRVVPNKYPAVVPDGKEAQVATKTDELRSGLGVHEVIIESPRHVNDMALLSERQFEDILRAYRDRITRLRTDNRFRYILIYKNQGIEAGATLEHVHSQLVALPTVPKQALEEINGSKEYYQLHGKCVLCDVIGKETRMGERMVAKNEYFIAICPFAPRFPYETWILPKQHWSSFEGNPQQQRRDLARILRETLIRLRRLGNPPLNYVIHSKPLQEVENDYYHWHVEIMPKLVQVGGFEWGSGYYINPVRPEESARSLRQVLS
jgi:UDPglucose--hexose-1-phosphate uridylyltransferase